jgi:DNA-binding response OmpR family regulator
MALFSVVICESDGQWAVRLRRALQSDRIRLRETRRLVDCQAEVAGSTASLVLLEWSAARRVELAEFVERITRQFPGVNVLALAARDAAGDEWLAREAGAIHFTSSPRALQPLLRLIRRHCDRAASTEDDSSQQFFKSLIGNSE